MSNIRLHWMQNIMDIDTNTLKRICDKLDTAGYHSILLPFHSQAPDSWIKAAHVLDQNQKIKYMIALRPYHLSPQYFGMMVSAFNQIQKDRLIINMIAGDVNNRNDEVDQMDVYGETNNLLEINQRKEFVRKFLYTCKDIDLLKNDMPEIVFSGLSDYTIETTNLFGSTILCMYDDYFNNIDRLKECKRRMVSVRILIRDTQEEADKEISRAKDTRQKLYTLYGTEDHVFEKIKQSINAGITDFLIGGQHFDKEIYRVHEFVGKISNML